MISVIAKHIETSGRILVARAMGAAGATIKPLRKHYAMRGSYLLVPGNGSGSTTVPFIFPGDKYTALATSPTWAHHRFLGWFDAAGTPNAAGTTTGNAVTKDDKVDFERPAVYAQWQTPTAVTFDAAAGSMPSGWTSPDYYAGQAFGTLPVPTHATLDFAGWYANGSLVTAASIVPSGGVTLVATYVSSSYTVDLNDEWLDPEHPSDATHAGYWDWDEETGDKTWIEEDYPYTPPVNPDSTAYDGVYESIQGPERDDHTAWLRIHLIGYTSFRVLIRSNAESEYDYMVALAADVDPYEEDLPTGWELADDYRVVASTKGNQNSSSAASAYTAVDYDLDGGEHDIWLGFMKDGSDWGGADRGYILIPKVQGA